MQIDATHSIPSTVRASAAPPHYALPAAPQSDRDGDSDGSTSSAPDGSSAATGGTGTTGRGQAVNTLA